MEYSTKGFTVLDSIPDVPGSNLGLTTDHPDCKFSKSVRANIMRDSSGDIATTLLVVRSRSSRTIIAMRRYVYLPQDIQNDNRTNPQSYSIPWVKVARG